MDLLKNKIVLILIVAAIVGGIFFLTRYKNGSLVDLGEVPAEFRRDYPLSDSGEPVSGVFAEEGRKTLYFDGAVPEGFPEDMPIDATPLEVVRSYSAFVQGDESAGLADSVETVYAYVTEVSSQAVFDSFKQYFKDKNIDAELESAGKTQIIRATEGDRTTLISIVPEGGNLFVTISVTEVQRTQ